MLAIIRYFEKWDIELRNVKFEIRIDHKNLEYFMTVKKLTERQIKWSLSLFKYDFLINYITGKNNERTDIFRNGNKIYPKLVMINWNIKWSQLLKPGMLNFKEAEIDKSETSDDSPQPGYFFKIQPVATGKNGVEFQPITIQESENELKICGPRPRAMTTFTNRW